MPIHTFFIRNSFISTLYWDGQIAKKLSVLKQQRLRNLECFSFSYHNFEDTVTNFVDNDMFKKNLSVVQNLIVTRKPNLKVSLFVFNYKTVFTFACCSILEKNVKKLLRNFEYSKSQEAKKLLLLRPGLSFL